MTLSRRDRTLVFAYLDGRATPAQETELRTRMARDAAVREQVEQGEDLVRALAEAPELSPPCDLVSAAERKLAEAEPVRRVRLAPMALAASLALAALVLWGVLGPAYLIRPPTQGRLAVTSVSGDVAVRAVDSRRASSVGDTVRPGEQIEAARSASFAVSLPDRLRVTADEQTQVTVVSLELGRLTLRLEQGVVGAELEQGAPSLSVQVGGSPWRAELREGALGVLTDGAGRVVVACQRGQASVIRQGESIELAAGSEVHLRDAKADQPQAVRPALELAVESVQQQSAQVGARVRLQGRTNPGAEVWVNAERMVVDAEGRFAYTAALRPSDGRLVVAARDVLRRKRELAVALAPIPRASPGGPRHRPLETEWEWEEPGRGPG